MEGGHAAQQAPLQSARWLRFAEWLARQAGGPAEEAVSEASASDAEEADPLPPADHPAAVAAAQPSSSSSGSSGRSAGGGTPAAGHLARHATLAPRLPDCRAETRLTAESASRARQEMTVVLAAPGMPLHQAPVLTARQASALMAAICEPLLSLPVGRLTRKLTAPTKLQPTEDRGVLSLWLLPDDSLSLVWQSAQQLAPAELPAAAAARSGGGDAATGSSAETSSSAEAEPQPQQPQQQQPELRQACSVAVWEELAHFPAGAHLMDDAPVVTIHMLRGDASGRSFYIRVRDDVAEANLEAATAAVPDAAGLLAAQAAAAREGGSGASASSAVEGGGAPRMYFWLADRDLGRAVYALGRLKSLLKRPPTLSKRSGVPEHQLAQLGAWVARADAAAAAEQLRQASAAATEQQQQQQLEQQQEEERGQVEATEAQAADAAPLGGTAVRPPSARPGGPLAPLLQAPGLLLGQHSMVAQGGMAALLPAVAQPAPLVAAAAAPAPTSSASASGEAGAVASGSSTVSATAAALYQDQRFQLVCPCTISVVVSMHVEGEACDPAALPAEASARARTVAERQAKSAVDRSGRQRIEERLAEVVIRNIRAQRNRARQARQAQRDGASRAAAAERALALARQATGRTPPAQQQQEQQESQEEEEAAAWEPDAPSALPQPTPFDVACSASSAGEVASSATPTPSLGATISSPLGSSDGAASGDAGSSSMPAQLLPGGRVTINNLASLLNPAPPSSAGTASGHGQPPSAHAPAPVAAAAGAGAGPEAPRASASSAGLSVSDLADLLGKHAKLE